MDLHDGVVDGPLKDPSEPDFVVTVRYHSCKCMINICTYERPDYPRKDEI